MKSILVGDCPIKVGEFESTSDEMFFYQYLPVKMQYFLSTRGNVPLQLRHLVPLIQRVCEDFMDTYGAIEFLEHYVYLSAKNQYAKTGENINREGWHLDGFMSKDVNYVWSDSLATEWSPDQVEVPYSHKECLEVLNNRNYDKILRCEDDSIYRINEKVIHRPQINTGKPFMRKFVKISFSKEKYNLKGNAHNYLIDYKWDMISRNIERNHPTKEVDK